MSVCLNRVRIEHPFSTFAPKGGLKSDSNIRNFT